MKTILKGWLGLSVIAAAIVLYRGDVVISDENSPQAVVELPPADKEAVTSTSSTEITKNGSFRNYFTMLDLDESNWASACRTPGDSNSCSLAYRSTYRLPPELGDPAVDRHFSIWMGYNKRQLVTVSMDWFDKDVADFIDAVKDPLNWGEQYEIKTGLFV